MLGACDNAANTNACCVFELLGILIDLQAADQPGTRAPQTLSVDTGIYAPDRPFVLHRCVI